MLKLKTFQAALRGNDSRLVSDAGPDGVVRISEELSSALVVPGGSGQLVLGTVRERGAGEVWTIALPDGFQAREAAVEDGRFVLTGVDGTVVRGTPEELRASPGAVLEEYEVPARRGDVVDDPPTVDVGLSETHLAAIAEAGEVMVPMGGEDPVWVTFDCAGPEQVVELVPHARELLASFGQLGRSAAEYLLAEMNRIDDEDDEDEDDDDEDDGEDVDEDEDVVVVLEAHDDEEFGEDEEFDEEEFLADMVPTGMVVFSTGDFELHFEGASDVYYLDGYWPSVQFKPDRVPVGFTIEA